MKVFILFSLLICLTGYSFLCKRVLYRRHVRFVSILSEGK